MDISFPWRQNSPWQLQHTRPISQEAEKGGERERLSEANNRKDSYNMWGRKDEERKVVFLLICIYMYMFQILLLLWLLCWPWLHMYVLLHINYLLFQGKFLTSRSMEESTLPVSRPTSLPTLPTSRPNPLWWLIGRQVFSLSGVSCTCKMYSVHVHNYLSVRWHFGPCRSPTSRAQCTVPQRITRLHSCPTWGPGGTTCSSGVELKQDQRPPAQWLWTRTQVLLIHCTVMYITTCINHIILQAHLLHLLLLLLHLLLLLLLPFPLMSLQYQKRYMYVYLYIWLSCDTYLSSLTTPPSLSYPFALPQKQGLPTPSICLSNSPIHLFSSKLCMQTFSALQRQSNPLEQYVPFQVLKQPTGTWWSLGLQVILIRSWCYHFQAHQLLQELHRRRNRGGGALGAHAPPEIFFFNCAPPRSTQV